jgi:penicillin-binding protein 1C
MNQVAGVSGAAPVMHALVTHLHERRWPTAFVRPADVAEDWVDPLTGHRCGAARPGAVRENFLTTAPPPLARDSDYDEVGRVRLGREYATWFRSGDNALGNRATLGAAADVTTVRLVSPLPGNRYFLDPDLPDQGRWLLLRAEGPTTLEWSSPTLEIAGANGSPRARLVEGRHRITVTAPDSGQRADAEIEVRRR